MGIPGWELWRERSSSLSFSVELFSITKAFLVLGIHMGISMGFSCALFLEFGFVLPLIFC